MTKQQTESMVFSFMEKHGMIRPGDRLILGVSGGADSVCLLFLLLEYRKRVAFEMTAVHVNHELRGSAAEEDAAYVDKLCREQGVGFKLVSADVKSMADREKCSEEDAGRRLRYRAFTEAAEKLGGTKIAVAHNAGDRAETLLLHLFRGSGLRGLRGIEPVRRESVRFGDIASEGRADSSQESIAVIRPLLCLEREEIENYLREQGIIWRTDSTNGEDEYTRNRIRHHLLPWAEREVSGRVTEHLCRTADILSEAEEYLQLMTCEAIEGCVTRASGRFGECVEIDVEGFLQYHPALRKRMILFLAEKLSPTGKDISAVHLEEVLALFEREGNRSVSLPFGICFWRRYGKIMAGRREEGSCGRAVSLPELEFTQFFLGNKEEVPRNQYTKWFDCDKIKEPPVLRFRQRGDYLSLSDGSGNVMHKSLKDYMIAEKIPREMRDRIPVLAEGSHVLWLIGFRISEYYKVDRNTKRILQVKLKRDCLDSE